MPHRLCASVALVLASAFALCMLGAAKAPADDSVRLSLRLASGEHITAARTSVHLVTYDVNHTLMSLLGNRAAPTTLVDTRTEVIDVMQGVRIQTDVTDLRRFGGVNPKDKSVVTRHDHYAGALAPNGVRTPALARLPDAGDGALDELPSTPLHVGQTWTFSRPISIERSLGQGTMTYTDTLTGLSDRNGHRIATIAVSGTAVAQPASDLRAKGFHNSTLTLHGNAEFDVTAGMPGRQHFEAQVEWAARVLFTRIGVKFADTYDSGGWVVAAAHP